MLFLKPSLKTLNLQLPRAKSKAFNPFKNKTKTFNLHEQKQKPSTSLKAKTKTFNL